MNNKTFNTVIKSTLENRLLSRWLVLCIDSAIIVLATLSSYLMSLQIYNNLGVIHHPKLITFGIITVFFNGAFFLFFRTYKGIIRHTGIQEFQRILTSLFFSGFFVFIALFKGIGTSGSVSLAYTVSLVLMSIIGLYGFRLFVFYTYRILIRSSGSQPPVFLWGLDKENLERCQVLRSSNSQYNIKGFIVQECDSSLKKLSSLPVLTFNTPKDLVNLGVKGILFTNKQAIKENNKIIEEILDMHIHVYITQQMDINNSAQLSQTINTIRPIQIEDLLGRPEISISMESISENVKNKIILVTGAAGSIGSEIVRQLANFQPQCIICFDQAETPLNDLTLELEKKFSQLNFLSVLGDIRNKNRTVSVFEKYRPDIVYHAAAYKHVPMMEKDPCEAILTNVMGTKLLVDLSIKYSVSMFVMVSTDKAVNPTNVMGASKRIAEIYVQSCALDKQHNKSKTKFVTTRFGNVLGSNGSVIPLFRKQIEKGGPITVTHPDIIRYFMTIPEACRLVLEASVIGKSGYIYVFDMGEPVKIFDLATRMIELAGLKPEKDIQIDFTGLRPGEKLFEELLTNSEVSLSTSHEKVMIAKVREYSYQDILPQIENIIMLARNGEKYKMISFMKELVPEYISKNSIFESLDKKKPKSIIPEQVN